MNLQLYLVTNYNENIILEAVRGGVTMVQLREKTLSTGEFVAKAKRLKQLLAPYNVPLIINDRVDVALACDADGVHIGQSDMSYEDARRLLGKDKIIGLSIESIQDLMIANELNLDYVAFSPVFSTPTKTDTAPPFGIEGLKKAVPLCKHPCCGIGGINISNIQELMSCGLDGVAVISAICNSDNPYLASKELATIITKLQNSFSSYY